MFTISLCFLNRKKRQQMIKRRTKRQRQKGRKEPKAKMKLNKRMLKKKTTLKTEIPKLMRYLSCSKHGSENRDWEDSAGGGDPASWLEGGGFHCHPVQTSHVQCLARAAPRASRNEVFFRLLLF